MDTKQKVDRFPLPEKAPCLPVLLAGICLAFGGACRAPLPSGPSETPSPVQDGPFAGRPLRDDMETIQDWYGLLFGLTRDEVRPVRVRLDGGRAASECDLYPACYRPEEALVLFHRPPNRMLLLHELAHHYLHQVLSAPPLWLDEGVATYLGWSAMNDRRLVPGEIPVVHYRVLRECLGGEAPPSLAALARLTHRGFYAPETLQRNYALAWGMVYYLFRIRLPAGLSFRAKVDRAARLEAADLAALDEPFRSFWRSFSVERMLVERLSGGDDLRRLSSAFRLGLLQDPASFHALLRQALDPSAPERLRRVCLLAAAVTVEGAPGTGLREELLHALGGLSRTGADGLTRTARELERLVRNAGGGAVVKRFEVLGRNSDFYPGDRILAVERLSRGMGSGVEEGGRPGGAQRSKDTETVLPGATITSRASR